MTLYTTDQCFGCKAAIPADGGFYCEACTTRQLAEYAEEMRAFNNYHEWADQIARMDWERS